MKPVLLRSPLPLRDVLYEMSLAMPVPNAELLEEFVHRHPEHAAALTDYAIDIAVDALHESAAEPVEAENTAPGRFSPAVSRAMSRFQNKLFATRNAKVPAAARDLSPTSGAQNPFSALDRESFRSLARRLDVNTVLVSKLRDRLIAPHTIPEAFRSRVAKELRVPVDVLAAHLAAEPQPSAQPQFLKAESKPTAGSRQSFEDAVRSSGLSDIQQRYLLGRDSSR